MGAVALLCLALAQEPSPATPRDRGIALLRKGDIAAALPELRAAVAADPADAVAQDSLGVALGESGQPDAAAAAFREAIRLDPRRSEAHFHLGAILDRLGRGREAVGRIRDRAAARPDSVDARYGLSVVSAKRATWTARSSSCATSRPDRARPRRRALRPRPPSLEPLSLRTRLRQPADLEEAERALRRRWSWTRSRARSRLALGQFLAERQRLDDAVAELREAASLAGGDPAYAYDLGLALALQGDLEGAETQLRAAIAGNPKHAEARRALGLILRQKGDLSAAAAELRASVAETPRDAQAHNVLGTVLLKLEDVDGAVAGVPPGHPARAAPDRGLRQPGPGPDEDGTRAEARVTLGEVQDLEAEDAARARAMILVEMASKQTGRGETGAAVASLREAVSASPDFAEAQYQLGLALRRGPGAAAGGVGGGGCAAGRGEARPQPRRRPLRVGAAPRRARGPGGGERSAPARGRAAAEPGRRAPGAGPARARRRMTAPPRWGSCRGPWPGSRGDARTRYDLAAALKASGDAAGAARELAAGAEARSSPSRRPALTPPRVRAGGLARRGHDPYAVVRELVVHAGGFVLRHVAGDAALARDRAGAAGMVLRRGRAAAAGDAAACTWQLRQRGS